MIAGDFVNWAVSPDGKYLTFTTGGVEPKIQRLRFADREIETIASLRDLRRVVDSGADRWYSSQCRAGRLPGAYSRHRHARDICPHREMAVKRFAIGAPHWTRAFHATIGALDYPCAMTLSARNQLKGTVEEIQLGGVMAHVAVRVGENLIESVITRRSAEEMALKKGDAVRAVIKSTEVMLQKD